VDDDTPKEFTAQHGVHADPAPLRLAGQAGWILTVKLAFFVSLSFARFMGESRPTSRRYPLQDATRTRAVGLLNSLFVKIFLKLKN